jgi:hypothetical protein
MGRLSGAGQGKGGLDPALAGRAGRLSRFYRFYRLNRASRAVQPRPYGQFLDDPPIHIRPDLPAARVQSKQTLWV